MGKSYYELINEKIERDRDDPRKAEDVEQAIEASKRIEELAMRRAQLIKAEEYDRKIAAMMKDREAGRKDERPRPTSATEIEYRKVAMMKDLQSANPGLIRKLGKYLDEAMLKVMSQSIITASPASPFSTDRDDLVDAMTFTAQMMGQPKPEKTLVDKYRGNDAYVYLLDDPFIEKPKRDGFIEFPLYAPSADDKRPSDQIGSCRLAALTATRLDEGDFKALSLIEQQKMTALSFDVSNAEAVAEIATRRVDCQVWCKRRGFGKDIRIVEWRLVVPDPAQQWEVMVARTLWLG